jgi:hypothetical protein
MDAFEATRMQTSPTHGRLPATASSLSPAVYVRALQPMRLEPPYSGDKQTSAPALPGGTTWLQPLK